MEDQMEVTIVGIKMGTASGWDQAGGFSLVFYDFVPTEKFAAVTPSDAVSIYVDTHKGDVDFYDAEGGVVHTATFPELIRAAGVL